MRKILSLIIIVSLFLPFSSLIAQDQDELTLAITPPLVKNNVKAGQIWRSTVKLVNNNPKEMEAYIEIRDFRGGPETGTVEFLSEEEVAEEEGNDFLLSQWISIDQDSIIVPPFGSVEIPYSITVPENAEPGGHYGAILAGSRPPDNTRGGSSIKISSLLASLILLNVNGEVVESGMIREFSTNKKFFSKPEVNFNVRFENTGNVHIQPRGEIRITNMYKKDVEVLKINHNTDFGNVLPKSIRKWDFSWQGESNIKNMGRYKAVLILGYGEQVKETDDRTIYFWVINWKIVLGVLGGIILFIFVLIYLIKAYIRRAIIKTQKMAGLVVPQKEAKKHKITVLNDDSSSLSRATIKHKKKSDNNTKKTMKKIESNNETSFKWSNFKKIIIAVIVILLILVFVLVLNNKDEKIEEANPATQNTPSENTPPASGIQVLEYEEKDLDVVIDKKSTTTLATSSEEKIEATSSEKIIEELIEEEKELVKEDYTVDVLNGSGQAGQAGKAATKIRADGFTVDQVGNADKYDYNKTLIQHSKDALEAAEYIGELLLVEPTYEELNGDELIKVIIGKDYK